MNTNSERWGLVLGCDPQGQIQQIYDDRLGITKQVVLPQPFTTLMDPSSVDKAQSFLGKVQEVGMACDWELNLLVPDDEPLLFHFVGTWMEEGALIVGVQRRADLGRYWHQQLGQVEDRVLRTEFTTQIPDTMEGQARDYEIFNEISRLNNDLATVQRELVKKQAQLEQLISQKNDLLGMAAHDLRNPLSAIQMFSKVLLDDKVLTGEQLELLQAIHESSTSSLSLLHGLLTIAQIEAGRLNLRLELTSLVPLLRSQVSLHSMVARSKQIEIVLQLTPDLPKVWVDRAKFQQVLENLLSNASKFSYPHTRIDVCVVVHAHEVVVSVRDEGQGIPRHEQERLFLPFSKLSVRPTAGEPSTGLGLSIVRRIVLAHGGRIWVESEANQGATFFVSMPLDPASPGEKSAGDR